MKLFGVHMFNKDLLERAGFSEKAIKYILENKNCGEIKDSTVKGSSTGACGDTIIVYLKLDGNRIKDAGFIYTGSAVAGLTLREGKTPEKVDKLCLEYKKDDQGLSEFEHHGNTARGGLKDALKKVRPKRIAFASEKDKGLESTLSEHFGRSPYYVFVDVEEGKIKRVETKKNPFSEKHEPGAVPEFIAREKAGIIVSGGMGYRAIEWFRKLGIKPVITEPGKIRDILERYLKGEIKE